MEKILKFKQRLQEIRKSKLLTQRDLADSLGINVATIKNWESSKKTFTPTIQDLFKIAEILKTIPESFFSEPTILGENISTSDTILSQLSDNETVELSKSDIEDIRSLLREVFERMDKQDELIEELKNQMD